MRKDTTDTHGRGPADNIDLLEQMGYETRDVSLPGLSRWLIVFAVFLGAATIGSLALYHKLIPDFARDQSSAPMMHVRHVPPFPQIQAEPRRDMMEYRTAEDGVLAGGPSASAKAGTSIDDAIATIANVRGISGIRGSALPKLGSTNHSYPGGGDYGAASTNGATSSMPTVEHEGYSTNGMHSGTTGMGIVPPSASQIPGTSPAPSGKTTP